MGLLRSSRTAMSVSALRAGLAGVLSGVAPGMSTHSCGPSLENALPLPAGEAGDRTPPLRDGVEPSAAAAMRLACHWRLPPLLALLGEPRGLPWKLLLLLALPPAAAAARVALAPSPWKELEVWASLPELLRPSAASLEVRRFFLLPLLRERKKPAMPPLLLSCEASRSRDDGSSLCTGSRSGGRGREKAKRRARDQAGDGSTRSQWSAAAGTEGWLCVCVCVHVCTAEVLGEVSGRVEGGRD